MRIAAEFRFQFRNLCSPPFKFLLIFGMNFFLGIEMVKVNWEGEVKGFNAQEWRHQLLCLRRRWDRVRTGFDGPARDPTFAADLRDFLSRVNEQSVREFGEEGPKKPEDIILMARIIDFIIAIGNNTAVIPQNDPQEEI